MWAVAGGGASVDIALLEGALAGVGRLGGWVVLAQLRVAVGLGALQQRLLRRINILWLALQRCRRVISHSAN